MKIPFFKNLSHKTTRKASLNSFYEPLKVIIIFRRCERFSKKMKLESFDAIISYGFAAKWTHIATPDEDSTESSLRPHHLYFI